LLRHGFIDASFPYPEISVVNFRLQTVLDSQVLGFRWDQEPAETMTLGKLQCTLNGESVFSLLTDEGWISDDSSVQAFLDTLEETAPMFESSSDSAATCLLLGLVMWWAHSESLSNIKLAEHINIPGRNDSVVAHWDSQYRLFLQEDDIFHADFVIGISHTWFDLC
jgi:hypothetical protein